MSRRQSVNIVPVPGSSSGQHHPAYENKSNHLHDSAPSLNYQHQNHEKRSSNGSERHSSIQHRRVSSSAAPSSSYKHASMNMVGSSPDRPNGSRKQPTQQVMVGRRHSTAIDPRAVKEAARRASSLAASSGNPYNLNHNSMPRIPSSDMVPGVDSSNHSRDRDRDRVRRPSSEKDQLPSKYNRFDESALIHDSHGSSSIGSSQNSGNLRANRASTSKQIKHDRSRDLQSLAELGLELHEELNASCETGSGYSGSDVAKVEPSRSKKGEGLSTNSGRSLDIDLDSVEAKAIIKLQKQLKNAQAEILSAHQKSSELSLDNAERGVQIHELTQQVKELLLLNEQANAVRVENENLQRKVKRGSGEAAAKIDTLRQDNDMLRREVEKLRMGGDARTAAGRTAGPVNEFGQAIAAEGGHKGSVLGASRGRGFRYTGPVVPRPSHEGRR